MEKCIVINQIEFDAAGKTQLVEVKCPQCDKIFYRQKNYVLRSRRTYCSRECASKSSRNSVVTNCACCGKELLLWQCRVKRAEKNFCSPRCTSRYNREFRKEIFPTVSLTNDELKNTTILIDNDSFNKLRIKELVPMKCKFCGNNFYQTKHMIIRTVRQGGFSGFCSTSCSNKNKSNKTKLNCKECNKEIYLSKSRIKPLKNNFCSKSCSITYRNKNKTDGYIRSKMEDFIESKIKEEFPNLECICNERKLLNGLELDFYFPKLKLAFELNGITHYEPIYGEDRLERSKDSDKRKMLLCYQLGVELAVIDISSIKYFKEKHGSKIFLEFKKILDPLV